MKLKENLDQSYVEDPLSRLKTKLEQKNLKFKLKTVSEEKVLKTIKSMKHKKISGLDGVTQVQMILGAEVLVVPLVQYVDQVECSVMEINRVTFGNVFIL